MSGPVYGGDNSLNEGNESKYKGVYAEHPAFTPKYNASASLDSTQTTQARLYIPVPNEGLYKRILSELPARARTYADALVQRGPQFAGRIYVDFVLQNVQEPLQEKVQVTEVLADTHIAYFFGQRAPTWNFSGIVLNTQQNQWYDAWHIVYRDILRGSKTSTYKVPVVIAYDTRRVVGSIIATTTSLRANNETFAQLNFSLLVKRVDYRPQSGAKASNFSVPATEISSELQNVLTKQVTAQTDTIKDQRNQTREAEIANTVAFATISPSLIATGGLDAVVDASGQPVPGSQASADLLAQQQAGAAAQTQSATARTTNTNVVLQGTLTGDYADVRSGADPLVLQSRFGTGSTSPNVANNTQTSDVQQTPNRATPADGPIRAE